MNEVRAAIVVGNGLLNEIKEEMGEDEYHKIVYGEVNGCSCGHIKKGNYIHCPKCELSQLVEKEIIE